MSKLDPEKVSSILMDCLFEGEVFDVTQGVYLNHDAAVGVASRCGLEWVPTLYRGEWNPSLVGLAEGNSAMADNVKEGIVVKPTTEQFDERASRAILKLHGEGFLRKQK